MLGVHVQAAKNGSWHSERKVFRNDGPQTCSAVLQNDEKNTAALTLDKNRSKKQQEYDQ